MNLRNMTEQEINSAMRDLDSIISQLEDDIKVLRTRQKALKKYLSKGESVETIDHVTAMIESRMMLLKDSSSKGFIKASVIFATLRSRMIKV